MSYNDYGDEPRRSSRRAPREPAGPSKVQGSTAAAILVFVAIVGFGIGALVASSGGDGGGGDETTAEDSGGAPPGSPDDATSDDQTGTESEDGSDTGDGTEESDDNSDEPVAGGNGITLTSPQDGGEVAARDTIDIQATLDSGEEGVTLRPERSLDGGQTWESFCEENCPGETSGTGTYTTNFWTGQAGENQFRVVGPDGLTSNPITVNIVEGDDEDSE